MAGLLFRCIMPSFFKKKELWGSVVALILLAYCVKDIRLDDMEKLIARVNFYFLFPALVMEFALNIVKGIRWRTIVEKTKKIPVFRVVTLFSAGQVVNIVMPALTGQVGRMLLFAKRESLSKTFVFSTILIEVLFDAISLLTFILLLSMAFVFPAEYRSISYIIAIITLSVFVILYLILHFKSQIGSLGRRLLRARRPGVYITLKKFSLSFTRGIDLLRSTQYFFRTLALSFAAWTAHIIVVYLLFRAFGFNLPLIAALVVMVVNTLALMIPITPGNAGTFELAVVAPLLAFKVVKSDAVLYALALHILDLIPIFILGFFFLRTERVTIREIKEAGEREEIPEDIAEDILVEKDK
jgi:uncharacterized protein (TIRG00374 family)